MVSPHPALGASRAGGASTPASATERSSRFAPPSSTPRVAAGGAWDGAAASGSGAGEGAGRGASAAPAASRLGRTEGLADLADDPTDDAEP